MTFNLFLKLILFACFTFYIFIPKAAYSVTLVEAIETAKVNNRNIKLEQTRLDSIKTEKTRAIAEFLPNVSANVGYGQRNSYYQGQTYDRSTKQRSEEIKLEQPIFDGLHSVSKYREASYKIKSSSAKTEDKIQEISFAAVQSYCNLLRYQQLIKLWSDNKKLGEKFLELVNRRKQARIIDKADIIKFTYETSLNEEKYLDVLNRLNKAQFDYQNIIGEIHQNLETPQITFEEFDQEQLLKLALTNNHNIKSYHYNYLASKAALNAEKSNFLPKVSVIASANKQDKVVYLNNADLDSRSVFLNVSVPVFQKGLEYANVSKAKYDRDAASIEYEIIKDNLAKEIRQVLEEYRYFAAINKTNQKLLELALRRAEIFSKRSKARIEDPIEVIRAKIEANQRQINYIESSLDLVISYYKIKYFLGEI